MTMRLDVDLTLSVAEAEQALRAGPDARDSTGGIRVGPGNLDALEGLLRCRVAEALADAAPRLITSAPKLAGLVAAQLRQPRPDGTSHLAVPLDVEVIVRPAQPRWAPPPVTV
jgi:hypothetical protein